MKFAACLAAFLITVLHSVSVAKGEVILIIDISNPAEITFTATGAHAENDDTLGTWASEGITLLEFFSFSIDIGMEFFDETNLRSPEGDFALTEFTSIDMEEFGSNYIHLNISGSGLADEQGFNTEEPALYGMAVADFSAWISQVKLGFGDVMAGDNSYGNIIIGQYQVVPEPVTTALLISGGAMVFASRRRRKL